MLFLRYKLTEKKWKKEKKITKLNNPLFILKIYIFFKFKTTRIFRQKKIDFLKIPNEAKWTCHQYTLIWIVFLCNQHKKIIKSANIIKKKHWRITIYVFSEFKKQHLD